MNEDLQFYTDLYVDQGYSYEEAEQMAKRFIEITTGVELDD